MLIDEIVDYAMKSKPLNLNMLREMVTDGLENGFRPSTPGIYEVIGNPSVPDAEPSIKLLPLGSSVPEKYYGDSFYFSRGKNEPCIGEIYPTPDTQLIYVALGDNITAITSSGYDVTEYIHIGDDSQLYFTDALFPDEYFEFDKGYVKYTNITVTCGNSSLTFVSGYYYGE